LAELADKPGSVVGSHSSTRYVTAALKQPTRTLTRAAPMRSLFGLAPGGVCRTGSLPNSRCALTAPFHPCRFVKNVGGIFLLHFPSARAAQALPGTLPCGARTFLGMA